MDFTPRVKEPRFASYGRGGPRRSTEDGEGVDSEEQQLSLLVDAEIERYNALYIRADGVCSVEDGFAEEEKTKMEGRVWGACVAYYRSRRDCFFCLLMCCLVGADIYIFASYAILRCAQYFQFEIIVVRCDATVFFFF